MNKRQNKKINKLADKILRQDCNQVLTEYEINILSIHWKYPKKKVRVFFL